MNDNRVVRAAARAFAVCCADLNAAAIAALRSSQGDDPSRWRATMPQIEFQSLDVGSIGNIPWENRGTWAQAVALGGR